MTNVTVYRSSMVCVLDALYLMEKHYLITSCCANGINRLFSKKRNLSKSYSLPNYLVKDEQFILKFKSEEIPLSIFGKHNLYNLLT